MSQLHFPMRSVSIKNSIYRKTINRVYGTNGRPIIFKKTSVTVKHIYHFFSCSSLFLQEGCAKWPEQVPNTKVLFLMDLHWVSNGARQLPCFFSQSSEILIWLLLTETFESPCIGFTPVDNTQPKVA
jgi:hypothetical protein